MTQRAADAEGVGIDAVDAKEQTALRVDGRALSLEVTYAVKRLVKGLASSREGSRQGFTLALCLLLRTIPDLDGARLFTLVHDLLPIKGGGMSDSEIKDNNFGRLFACMALIQTRKCAPSTAEWSAAVSSDSIHSLLCVKVLQELVRLRGCKSFMAEATAQSMQSVFEMVLTHIPADQVTTHMLDLLGKDDDVVNMTPEQLQLHLFAQRRVKAGKAACVKETELGKLVEPLKKSTASHPRLHQVWGELFELLAGMPDEEQASKRALATRGRWGDAGRKTLVSLWDLVVEDALLQSSHERKFAALELLARLADDATLPASTLMVLISANARRTLINNLGNKRCLLYTVSHKAWDAVMARAKTDPAFAFDLLQLLASNHRSFDKVTHTRTTSLLLQYLDKEGKLAYLTMLLHGYAEATRTLASMPMAEKSRSKTSSRDAGQGEDEEGEGKGAAAKAAARQRWAVESIYSLATRQRADLPVAVLEGILCWLLHTAFFTAGKGPKNKAKRGGADEEAAPSDELRQLCTARLFSLIEALATPAQPGPLSEGNQSGAGGLTVVAERSFKTAPTEVRKALVRVCPIADAVLDKAASLAEADPALVTADPALYWPLRAHLVWQALEMAGAKVGVQLDEAARSVRSDMWSTVKTLVQGSLAQKSSASKPSGLGVRECRALAVLFLYTGLELLSDPAAAVKVVQELHETYRRVLSLRRDGGAAKGKALKPKPTLKSKRAAAEQDEESAGQDESEASSQDEVMAVLVELLVSLLARPSAVLRSVVKTTFRAFSDSMTPSTIEVLVQVLSEAGNELFAASDDEDEMDEEDEDDTGDEEESDDDDSEGGEDMAEDAEVAKALSSTGRAEGARLSNKRKAVGDGEEEEHESSSDDGEEHEGEDWDDDKMFEIDHLVGQAFKSRMEEQRVAKETASMSLVLKLRTLELVEVLLTRKEPNANTLLLLEPLLDLAISGASGDKKGGESAQQRVSFHAKVMALYADKLCRMRPAPAAASMAQAKEALAMLTRLCKRMPVHGELAGSGISFLLRVLAASGPSYAGTLDKAVAEVGTLLDTWASKRHSNINPLFFRSTCHADRHAAPLCLFASVSAGEAAEATDTVPTQPTL